MSEGPTDGPSENDGGWGDDGYDDEVPEQVSAYRESYTNNLAPFAMDPDLSDDQFGYFQNLYYDGFVGGHSRGAREAFIDALYDRYDVDFDWDSWREEYESV